MFKRIRRLGKETLLQVSPGVFWAYVRARHGYLEPEMALLRRLCLPDQTSVDVGANFGIYSYYMLKYSRKCVAFEPYPHLAKLLRRGLRNRLEVHEVALSDRSGTATLRASFHQTGHNTIEPSNRVESKVLNPSSLETIDVPVASLDDFDLGPVGFIKIDVQGHETEVIAGAARTIERHLPALLIELEEQHRTGAREHLVGRLGALGYKAFYMRAGVLRPADDFDPEVDQNPARPADYIQNFIFLPAHRTDAFSPEIIGQ
jgi:FkbM family methyltransferase